ncbi:MAG: SH3 domain-containing protein [Ginsengibacter sp.]
MALSKKIRNLPLVVLIIFVLLGIVILYRLIIFLSKFFTYLGFNLFFYIDNLLKFDSANPVILWGIFGLFIGSIFGVIIAIKKYRLSKILVLYPLAVTILGIIILSFINKPMDVGDRFMPAKNTEIINPNEPVNKVPVFTVTRTLYIHAGPSAGSKKLFTLSKGTQVGVIESIKDSRNNTWSKIEYIDPQTSNKKTGYVNAGNLRQY